MESMHLHPCSTKRSLGNFYFCVNDGWVKPCDLFAVDSGVCHSVPDGLNDNISAFGPDRGIGCILYGCANLSSVTSKEGRSPNDFWPQELRLQRELYLCGLPRQLLPGPGELWRPHVLFQMYRFQLSIPVSPPSSPDTLPPIKFAPDELNKWPSYTRILSSCLSADDLLHAIVMI